MDSLDNCWIQDSIFDELEAARESMHIPDLSAAWLGVLSEDGGLPDISTTTLRIGGRPLTRPVLEDPANTPSDPNTFPARLANGQCVWVKLDERISGKPSVHVVDKPVGDRAVLAALTIMESLPVNIHELKEFLLQLDFSHPKGLQKSADEVSSQILFDEARHEECLSRGPIFRSLADKPLRYAIALLRYYRPNFDSLPTDQKRTLLIGCCERMNTFIDSTRQLSEFLEYGTPSRDQRRAVENPARDVRAAVLRDVHGSPYRLIALRLGVIVSEKARSVEDFSVIGKMVRRGRDILERAFGEVAWQKKAAELKEEFSKRSSLRDSMTAYLEGGFSFSEEIIEDNAVCWGVSLEHAKNILEGKASLPFELVHEYGSKLPLVRNYYMALVAEEGKLS